MKVVRGLVVAILGVLLLGAAAAGGYALGRGDSERSLLRTAPVATATPDRCATEATAYANAGASNNASVFLVAREDYQKCRQRYP